MSESWSLVFTNPFLIFVCLLFVVYVICDWLVHCLWIPGGAVNRWVLITGCDTGFGNQAAKHLDLIGCRVIAGCLTTSGCSALKSECSSRLVTLQMDVADEESVQHAYQAVTELLRPEDGVLIKCFLRS